MRHGNKINNLSRTASHRKAMLANMSSSLIKHKRITTTVAKAKALKKYLEPLVTKAKNDTTHSRRVVFSYLQDKQSVSMLFDEVARKIGDRPGGYTRIIKMAPRLGDNAEMCMMEFVDFNGLLLKEAKPAKSKRSRRGSKKSTEGAATSSENVTEEVSTTEKDDATPDVVDTVVEEVAKEDEVSAESSIEAEATSEEAAEDKTSDEEAGEASEEEKKED